MSTKLLVTTKIRYHENNLIRSQLRQGMKRSLVVQECESTVDTLKGELDA